MPQQRNVPFGLTDPAIDQQLGAVEALAAQLPELFRLAQARAYDEAITKAVGHGFPDAKANLLMDYNPYTRAPLGALAA